MELGMEERIGVEAFVKEMAALPPIILEMKSEIHELKIKLATETIKKEEALNKYEEALNKYEEGVLKNNQLEQEVRIMKQQLKNFNTERRELEVGFETVKKELEVGFETVKKELEDGFQTVKKELKKGFLTEKKEQEVKIEKITAELQTAYEYAKAGEEDFRNTLSLAAKTKQKLKDVSRENKILKHEAVLLSKHKMANEYKYYDDRNTTLRSIMDKLQELETVATTCSFFRRRTSKRQLINGMRHLIQKGMTTFIA